MNRNKGTIRFFCYQVAVYYVAESVKWQYLKAISAEIVQTL